ncbi:MAG: Beta-glucosidase BoGH3B [Opitutia bacterium UBA7350]|nr:MAG: Beta-glucosidase BoGH3B [Opitutae bacterium UBA7350]
MKNLAHFKLAWLSFITLTATLFAEPKSSEGVQYEQQVSDLMAQMNLQEKIGQMCQFVGFNYLLGSSAKMTPEAVLNSDSTAYYKDLKIKEIAHMIVDGKIGSFLHVLSAEEANQLQALAQKSRLKIPLLIGIDAIHGNAMVAGTTVYPSPISIAASFSNELAHRIARETAIEMRATGSHWAFSPNVDVLRDPRWGRVGETFGEDPFLVSELGKSMIEGYQLLDFTGTDKVIACAKHLVAGSEPSNGLNFSEMDVSERSLREIFLKPFKAAVESGVFTLMAAHNEVNGIPAHMHKEIMTDIVRQEYGFKGFYVSDWLDIERLELLHRVAKDFKEATRLAVDAGIDMHMHGPYFLEAVEALVISGDLPEARVDAACAKILEAKFKLGLFDDPFVEVDAIRDKIFTPQHQRTALEAARQSIILLENDGLLPLKPAQGKRILVTGPNANNPTILGDWAMAQPADNVTTVLEGMQLIAPKMGYQVEHHEFKEAVVDINKTDIEEAVAVAKNFDALVLVVGDNSLRYQWKKRTAGENLARADINLAGNQLELIQALHQTGVPLILVYVSGKPLAEPWVAGHLEAVIAAGEPGSFGGQAIAEIIMGTVNPSGKTPLTTPRSVGQLRMVYNHKPSQYFKKYAFGESTPLYPFGYGLSYSKFNYSNLKLELCQIDAADAIRLSFEVKNDSKVEGTEIVQVYFRDNISSVSRPVKELVAYERVPLSANELKEVVFYIPVKQLAFYDLHMQHCVEPGSFEFMVGPSSENTDLLREQIQVGKRYDF